MDALRRTDRLWMIGGLVLAVLLAAGSWFFVISGEYTDADDISGQAADAQVQVIRLQQRVSELKTESGKLGTFQAELKASEAALPSDSGVPDFLRQLTASGEKVGADVSGFNVAAPAESGAVPGVWELPMTVTADGSPSALSAFLNQVQAVQPRAVLIDAVTLAQSSTEDQAAVTMTLNLSLKAFVAPPAGSGAPTVTTD